MIVFFISFRLGNYRLRIVSVNGIISTLCGSGSSGYSGESIAATSSSFVSLQGNAVDSGNGDVYIATYGGNRVQVLTRATNLVSTFAGTGGSGFTGDGDAATAAQLSVPDAIFLNTNGNLYFTDGASRLRKVYTVMPTFSPTALPTVGPTAGPSSARSSSNFISTYVGTGTFSTTGTGGRATAATLSSPRGVFVDSVGFFYFAEADGNCIRGFSMSDNIVVSIAGSGSSGYAGDNGPATSAKIEYPMGIFLTTTGVLYIAANHNQAVRRVVSGVAYTFAGKGSTGSSGDGGPATSALLNAPIAIALDTTGKVYVSFSGTSNVRYIDTSGIIWLFAGNVDDVSLSFYC